ncbi:MAG: hypothetical protein EOL93_12730, partial [Epsilonproteobacteria bacterium]|nr:hypothetical protein [Campylobacterota bacterium]
MVHVLRRLYTFSFLPLVVLFVGVLFSMLMAWKSYQWIENVEEIRFDAASKEITALIQKELDSHVQLLNSSAAFIFASETITRNEWQTFAKMHDLAINFPSLYALGYVPLVEASKREAYEKKMAEDSAMAQYKIFPSFSSHSTLFPITYIEPFTEQTVQILGYDMGSEAMRRQNIEKALKKGSVTITPKIEFVKQAQASEKKGFIIYMPFYYRHHSLQNEAERLAAAKGVVYSAIKVNTFFENILKANDGLVSFEVYDCESLSEETLLYNSNSQLTKPRLERSVVFTSYDTHWTLYFKANSVLHNQLNHYFPHIQVFIGILFSILLSGWVYALQRTRSRAYEIVEEKTKQLSESEAWVRLLFKMMQKGVMVINREGVITECNDTAKKILPSFNKTLIGTLNSELPWKALHEDGSSFLPEELPFMKVLRSGESQNGIIMGIQRE